MITKGRKIFGYSWAAFCALLGFLNFFLYTKTHHGYSLISGTFVLLSGAFLAYTVWDLSRPIPLPKTTTEYYDKTSVKHLFQGK